MSLRPEENPCDVRTQKLEAVGPAVCGLRRGAREAARVLQTCFRQRGFAFALLSGLVQSAAGVKFLFKVRLAGSF